MFDYKNLASVEVFGGEPFEVFAARFHAADVRDITGRDDLPASVCNEVASAFLDYVTDFNFVYEVISDALYSIEHL